MNNTVVELGERMSSEEKKRKEEVDEELKFILTSISEWIDKGKDLVREIVNSLTSSLDGRKLGEDIAAFYNSLKNSGLPDELINEMVREYYKRRLEAIPSITEIIKAIREAVTREGRPRIIIRRDEEEKESSGSGEGKSE